MKKIIIITTLIFMFNNIFGGAGTAGSILLKIGPSGRGEGLSGAYSTLTDDVYSLYYNPAGLNRLNGINLSLTHNEYILDVRTEYLGAAMPIGDNQVIGISGYMLYVKDTIREDEYPANDGGSFMHLYQLYDIGYGMRFDSLLLGTNIKLGYDKIHIYSSSIVALDLGAIYENLYGFDVSFVLQNLGIRLSPFIKSKDPVPLNIKIGAKYTYNNKVTGVVEINKYLDSPIYAAIGSEYNIMDNFVLRAGYKINSDKGGLTGGFSILWRQFKIDYAFTWFHEISTVHRITLNTEFGAAFERSAQYRKIEKMRIVLTENEEYLKALEYAKLNKWRKSLVLLKELQKDYPEMAPVYTLMGFGYMNLKRYNSALDMFKKSYELDNNNNRVADMIKFLTK